MHANNTQAFEAAYDTNNTVLCDVRSGPAGLGLSIARVGMGKTFRAIDVTLSVLGAYDEITIYHLMLPPGSEPPTAAAIKSYDHTQTLALGGAVRGRRIARAGAKRVGYTIDRGLSPNPLPDETGPVDGFRYDCYFYAEDASGKASYIVKYRKPVMAMPFHTGRGTALSPFGIRELNKDELSRYPDLMPGHPLNSAGVAQAARMLDNIGRLRALHESSNGVYGLRRSLSLSYTLLTPMDLCGYKRAYGGRGWQPIGCLSDSAKGDRYKHSFSGTLKGGGLNTPIRNLQITLSQGSDSHMRHVGLFNALDQARVTDITIQDASLFIIAGGSSVHEQMSAGALAGRVKGGKLSRIRLERILILAAGTDPDRALMLGGLSGYAVNGVRLSDCRAKNLIIADMSACNSHVGGLLGGLASKRHTALLEDINVSSALIFGKDALGGAIGHVSGGATVIKRADISELTLYAQGMGAGGLAGVWASDASFNKQSLELIRIYRLSIIASGALTAASGGLIGLLTVRAPTRICDCAVTHSQIDCACASGGFLGLAISAYEGFLTVEDCAAEAAVSGAHMVGGFAGALDLAGLFQRCHASGGGVYGVLILGGFTGYSATTRFRGCESKQHVRPYSELALIEGGFVGLSVSSEYEDCHASGDVDSLIGFAGGFVGIQAGGTNEQLPNIAEQYIRCHAGGDVSGLAQAAYTTMAGGFMGLGTLFHMRECYCAGAVVSGAGGMGGLIAAIRASGPHPLKPIIEDCYSVSNLKCAANSGAIAGGIVGYADYGIIRRCYYSGVIFAGAPISGIAAAVSSLKGAVEISGCLITGGSMYGINADANRIACRNADDAFLSGNYASAVFDVYDDGALTDFTEDPHGPDGQTIDPNELPWFITRVLNWDTDRTWSLKTPSTRNRPLLRANVECT